MPLESDRDDTRGASQVKGRPSDRNHHLTTDDSSRERWILTFLYAPDAEPADPIYGEMHLMLSLFFMEQKLLEKEEFNDLGFEFESDFMGPVDEEVYQTLYALEEDGLVKQIPEQEHHSSKKGSMFQLTDEGKPIGKAGYESLSQSDQQLLTQIKRLQSEITLSRLISYLFSNYTDMFDGLVSPEEEDNDDVDLL